MLLGEIAEPYPVVGVNTSAFVAAQLLAKDRLPGLVVLKKTAHRRRSCRRHR